MLKKVDSFLHSLSDGIMLHKIAATALRALAGVAAIAGLLIIATLIDYMVNGMINFTQGMGAFISFIIIIIGVIAIMVVLLLRAKTIVSHQVKEYPITYLSSIIIKAAGESLTLLLTVIGLVSGLMVMLGAHIFALTDPLFNSGPSFIMGMGLLFRNLLLAITIFFFTYLISELLLLIRNIALKKE